MIDDAWEVEVDRDIAREAEFVSGVSCSPSTSSFKLSFEARIVAERRRFERRAIAAIEGTRRCL